MRLSSLLTVVALASPAAAQSVPLDQLRDEVAAEVARRAPFTAQLVDQLFSFGELGFQESESSRYLVGVLRDSGFVVTEGVAGIPTAWLAAWGRGGPVISLGSDIDAIPQASQYPGVACHLPMVEGAPGHGEGHNSGLAVNITAALAVRAVLTRHGMSATIRIWPGVAEELVGAKAHFVRAGLFTDVDIALFSHVANRFGTQWGAPTGTGLVSVEYTFEGETAHGAGAPWRGRSALDAVELMNAGWNYRREHLRPQHRSHYVITNGGDQPNVVPRRASVWYYFREVDEEHIRALWALGDTMAQAAAAMTGTRLVESRVLGTAWPQHHNRVVAEVLFGNVRRTGMPAWSDADQTLARGLQRELGVDPDGLELDTDSAVRPPVPPEDNPGGGSDDIGDVTWTVPTATLRFPSNIPNLPGHHWSNAVAMATPIAHKGATAGATALAMTVIEFVRRPALVDSAHAYFREQTRTQEYASLLREQDTPPIEMNAEAMGRFRGAMRPFYYDARRYRSYLDQLGVRYPTVRAADGSCPVPVR